jgi:hypothetical protein
MGGKTYESLNQHEEEVQSETNKVPVINTSTKSNIVLTSLDDLHQNLIEGVNVDYSDDDDDMEDVELGPSKFSKLSSTQNLSALTRKISGIFEKVIEQTATDIIDGFIANQDIEPGDELFGLNENSTYTERLLVLVQQAVPVVISFFLSIGGTFINLVFAGHYKDKETNESIVFAGISLANVSYPLFSPSIILFLSLKKKNYI